MLGKVIIFTLALTSCLVASQIVRPCQFTDYRCIGRILAANSYCNPNVVGSIPSRYSVRQLRFDVPYFNATYFDNNLIVSNSNRCRVSEFFLDRATNIAVIGVDCPRLSFQSNRLLIQHASLKEDRFYRYNIQGNYPLIRLTTNLYYQNGLDLCRSYTFADVAVLPTFITNPNNQLTRNLLNPLTVFERELFFWRSSLLGRYFINSYLCDFGCNY